MFVCVLAFEREKKTRNCLRAIASRVRAYLVLEIYSQSVVLLFMIK